MAEDKAAKKSKDNDKGGRPPAEITPLWNRMQQDDVAGVEEIIKGRDRDFDINMRDSTFGWTLAHCAANSSHGKMLKLILDAKGKVDSVCNEGNTPIIIATRRGHQTAVELLLSRKTSKDAANTNGWTAMIWGCINGYTEIVQVLMTAAADHNKVDTERRTACMWAARHGHIAIVDVLLACGSNLCQRDANGMTVADHAQEHMEMRAMLAAVEEINRQLVAASRRKDVAAMQGLISKGADLNIRDADGWTPLMWAALHNSLDMVELVLRHGAHPCLLDETGEAVQELCEQHLAVGDALYTTLGSNSRLLAAAKDAQWEQVDEELKIGAWINVRDEHQRTALMWAARHCSADDVASFLDKGAGIDDRDSFGLTATHIAVTSRSPECVSMLYSRGANFSAKTFEGETPLHLAVRVNDGVIIQLVLAASADMEEQNVEEYTALQLAAVEGAVVAMRTLLAYGANHAVKDRHKHTFFSLAVLNAQLCIVEALMEPLKAPPKVLMPGEDPNIPEPKKKAKGSSKKKDTAADAKGKKDKESNKLKEATKSDEVAAIAPLALMEKAAKRRAELGKLPAGPNANKLMTTPDKNGRQPIALAAHFRRHLIINLLLQQKVDVDAVDNDGVTPLMEAVITRQRDVVTQMLEAGARVDRVNNRDQTAINLCTDERILAILNQSMVLAKVPGGTAIPPEPPADENKKEKKGKTKKEAKPALPRFRVRLEDLPTNLPGDMLETEIREFLTEIGATKPGRIKVLLDPILSRPRGIAYVDFPDAVGAELAMRGDKHTVLECEVRVHWEGEQKKK